MTWRKKCLGLNSEGEAWSPHRKRWKSLGAQPGKGGLKEIVSCEEPLYLISIHLCKVQRAHSEKRAPNLILGLRLLKYF